MLNSFREVIGLWPSLRALSEEPEVGANLMAVRKWQQRDSIPSEEWMGIAKAAQKRGFSEVTIELLAQIKAAKVTEYQTIAPPSTGEPKPPEELQEAS